jgi:hypothetical protein
MKSLLLAFILFASAKALAYRPQLIFSPGTAVPAALQHVIQTVFNKSCPWDPEATLPEEFGTVVQEVSIDQGQIERHYLIGFQYESASGNVRSFSVSAVEYPVLNVNSKREHFAVTELPGFCF